MQAAAVPQAASLADVTGLTITADDGQPLVEGVDYELTADTATNTGGKLVVLKTERAVTVTGTSKDNYGLQVAAGVHASITFNNVTIKAPIPVSYTHLDVYKRQLFANVRVAQGAVVESSILMPGAVVEEGAEVCYSIIAENAVIKKGARVGARPETVEDKAKWGVAVVAEGRTIGENASVGPKAMLEKDVQDGEKLW